MSSKVLRYPYTALSFGAHVFRPETSACFRRFGDHGSFARCGPVCQIDLCRPGSSDDAITRLALDPRLSRRSVVGDALGESNRARGDGRFCVTERPNIAQCSSCASEGVDLGLGDM